MDKRYSSGAMELSPDMQQRLRDLLSAFLAENAKLNLSALRTEDAAWHGNILDSLFFLKLVEKGLLPPPGSILDIGTGGGFPLLPLALAFPQAQCTGIDSIGKKIEAVKRIIQSIGLDNVTLIADRAETLAHKPVHRGTYDVVVSRAVAPLATLLEYTSPFAKQDGHVVLWKSMHIDEELAASEAAQQALHCVLTHKYSYDLGGDWGSRQLLVFSRNGQTPRHYPRDVGEPKKVPIT